MRSYCFRVALSMIGAVLFATVVGGSLTRASAQVRFTGCLKPSGKLVRLQAGDDPTKPCKDQWSKITLMGVAPQALPPDQRTVFVTSSPFSGNLVGAAQSNFPESCGAVANGLDAGDCICQSVADEAGIGDPRVYRAWLGSAGGSPDTRFEKATVPYVLTNGEPIANSYHDLTTNLNLLNLFDVNENGGQGGDLFVWTGVESNGTVVLGGCDNWTATQGGFIGTIGDNSELNFTWSNVSGQGVCAGAHPLYLDVLRFNLTV